MTEHWIVVTTKAAGEFKAVDQLRDNGIIAVSPKETMWGRRVRGRRLVVERPLIRGYIFAQIGPMAWRLPDLEYCGKALGILDPKWLAELREAETQGVYDKTKGKGTMLHEGNTVKIATGPFKDRVGILGKLSADRRVKVMLAHMGPILVAKDALEAA